jgi:hypothetical protein
MTAESKPLTTFVPPPLSAVVSIAGFVSVALYYFPSIEDPDASVFTDRVFPEILSIKALLCLRLCFTLICLVGFLSAWWTPE